MIIRISDDFTKKPGGRLISEGNFSGELFREKYLKPAYIKSQRDSETLTIDLDGGYGYGTSFLEEAFGGLVRDLKDPSIQKIKIVSDEEPEQIEKIHGYIQDALKEVEE